jgi:hypothetical protein
MAAPAPHCDHRNQYWPTYPACPPDVGHEPGWMECDQEPTHGPATGILDHGPRTICLECWQQTHQVPWPAGFGFRQFAEEFTNELVYEQIAHGTVLRWDLRDHYTVRGNNRNIEATQTLLCKTCTKDEITRWRHCKADPNYENAFLASKAQWVADTSTNTCVCIKKYITHPHYW